MITIEPTITDYGKSLLLQAISGDEIVFTKIKLGNGEVLQGEDAAQFSDLKNPLVTIGISSVNTADTGYVKVSGIFDNTERLHDYSLILNRNHLLFPQPR